MESRHYFPVPHAYTRPSPELMATGSWVAWRMPIVRLARPERHAMFNCHARNKLSMTVDVRRPEARGGVASGAV